MSTQTENVKYVFEAVTDNAVKGLNSLSASFKKIGNVGKDFNNALKSATSSVNLLGKAASAFSGAAIGKALASATKEAVDFYETLNLFQVAMKDSIDVGNEFIDSVSEWYGLDPKNLMQYTGLFYEMAYAVSVPTKAAQQMSTSLTALSVDLASLFNVDVERVADNLTSGIRGMSRAVVKYGMDLRASTVEAYAHSLGITEQYETMDEASREILRYLVAVKQARDATGDFSRTIEQPANQLRVFKEQMSQVGRAVGTFLVQPLQAALPVINGVVMAIRVLLETLAALMGFKLEVDSRGGLEDAENSIASIGAGADSTKKKLKALLAPFDELNVIQENNSGGGGGASLDYGEVDPALLAALEEAQYALEEVRMKALDTRDAILDFFGFTPTDSGWMHSFDKFEENLKARLPNWTKSIEAAFDLNWDSIVANYYLVTNSMKRIIKEAVNVILQDFSRLTGIKITDDNLSAWISNLDDKFREFRIWLHENETAVATFIARFVELATAFAVFTTTASILSPVLSGIATGFSVIRTMVMPLVTLSATLATWFTSLSNSLGTLSTGLVVAGQSGGGFIGTVQTLLSTLTSLSGVVVAMGAAIATVFVGGFAKWAANSEVFRTYLTGWGESLKTIVIGVRDIFVAVFNIFAESIDRVSERFSSAFEAISAVIQNLLDTLAGLVDFIAGILTGDLTRALGGLYDAWWNFGAAVANTIVAVLNTGISAINNFVQKMVDQIFTVINSLLSKIPATVRALMGLPAFVSAPTVTLINPLPAVEPPTFPFANGGVVTGPTRALVGEAGKPEMIMPLGDSPQMNDFINKIVDKVGNSGKETVVKVYIGDREWDAFTYESAQRGKQLVGAQPVTIGG